MRSYLSEAGEAGICLGGRLAAWRSEYGRESLGVMLRLARLVVGAGAGTEGRGGEARKGASAPFEDLLVELVTSLAGQRRSFAPAWMRRAAALMTAARPPDGISADSIRVIDLLTQTDGIDGQGPLPLPWDAYPGTYVNDARGTLRLELLPGPVDVDAKMAWKRSSTVKTE